MAVNISIDAIIEWVRVKLGVTPTNDPNSAYGRFWLGNDGSHRTRLPAGSDWISSSLNSTPWNASTNSPSLADGVGTIGQMYRVSVAGTQNLGSGSTDFEAGDYIIYNDLAQWQKLKDLLAAGTSSFADNEFEIYDNADPTSKIQFNVSPVSPATTQTILPQDAPMTLLSTTNHTDLTDGGDSALHYHSSDRARANHTGTQTASTISDFDTEVSNNVDVAANTSARHTHANKATLDLINQDLSIGSSPSLDGTNINPLPDPVLEYEGSWNASTNTPTLADGVGNLGDIWRVSTAGTQNLGSGSIDFEADDYIIYNDLAQWQKIVQNVISNPINADVAIFKEVQPNGTNGGTFTSGAWRTRLLNSHVGNMSIASLSANTITVLQTGDYIISAYGVAMRGARHKCRININDVSFFYGSNAYSLTSDGDSNTSVVYTTLTLNQNDTIKLEHRTQLTQTVWGLGIATDFGVDEVYSEIILMRLA